MSNVFFTSDTHAFHKNITRGTSAWNPTQSGTLRNFDDEVDMTIEMARRINSVVGKKDTLYHLGDWSFGGKDKIALFRNIIDCDNIHLVLGNHDKHIRKKEEYQKLFTKVYPGILEKKISGQFMILSHYAHVVWNCSHHGAWNLFGHSHGTLSPWIREHLPNAKMLDVGVDFNEMLPWGMDALHAVLDHLPGSIVDHHNESTN